MIRANTDLNELARPNLRPRRGHPLWRWVAAGFLIVGIAGMNHDEPRGMGAARTGGGPAPMAGGQRSAMGGGFSAVGGGVAPPMGEDSAAPGAATGGEAAPQSAWNAPSTGGGFVPAAPAAATATASDSSSAEVPTAGDSVSDRVNTNFSDYMRDQQRVVSENDGQTYIVDSNAEPNQMVDTRDSVSGFSAATPGSDAAGYAAVAPSGATTVDTSTSTPVETSSPAAGEG